MGRTIKETNATHAVHIRLSHDEYHSLMKSLSQKQMELCTNVIKHIDTSVDQMFICIEAGAGVSEQRLASAIERPVQKYYEKLPGENPDNIYIITMAPTGMAAYPIHGSTIHSALQIHINKTLQQI